MWYRIRQFWRAITAHIGQGDYEFIRQRLSPGEQALFFQMAVCDQRHCLDVAYFVQALGQANLSSNQLEIVTKAALLHDVGKVAGDVGILDRVLITILQSTWPALLQKYASTGQYLYSTRRRKGFAYACFVHLVHAERGAHMLASFGCPQDIVSLVRRHHEVNGSSTNHDPGAPLLGVLQQADQEN